MKNKDKTTGASYFPKETPLLLTCNSSGAMSFDITGMELHGSSFAIDGKTMVPFVSTEAVSCTCKISMSMSWLSLFELFKVDVVEFADVDVELLPDIDDEDVDAT